MMIVVEVKVKDGERERLQAFEGVLLLNATVVSARPLLFVKSHTVWVLSERFRPTVHWLIVLMLSVVVMCVALSCITCVNYQVRRPELKKSFRNHGVLLKSDACVAFFLADCL